jgi:hypothetical protein
MADLRQATQQALEKVADALPAYIDGVAAREYLAVIHKALKQQQAEPVQHEYEVTANDDGTFIVELPDGEELRIIPPRREWKGLTEEEIGDVFQAARNAKLGSANDNSRHRLSVVEIARAVEAALKERNE